MHDQPQFEDQPAGDSSRNETARPATGKPAHGVLWGRLFGWTAVLAVATGMVWLVEAVREARIAARRSADK